ncbi:LysR family transcriptional regulator [Paraburkholderia caribensis]|uniref:LysR family transcriptional regulator n=1 Tax=Paraburkholderia caribensis TaxID=75105 RepID=UPI00078D2BE2|nr:LysR family transcriptional regulator [Paraburkholderia caribensis]AMV48331.1 hypothetical protein ATN79_47605 [Paraburkholderia caribensis]
MDGQHELMVFTRVVDEGNFSAAARSLSLTPSTISKLISRLEDRLGVALFVRAANQVSLTSEGKKFHEAAVKAIEAFEATKTAVFLGKLRSDTIRIRSTPAFGVTMLAPLLPAFCRQHPSIRVEAVLSMAPGNLLEGGVDVAIHVGSLPSSSLIARRFGETRWIICAAPAYVERHGIPRTPADLDKHECLNFFPGIPGETWSTRSADGSIHNLDVTGRIVSNNGAMLLELAKRGAGIARLTDFHIAEHLRSGALVELFPKYQSRDRDPIYAVYRSRRHLSPRISVFLDFLDESFAKARSH